MMLRNAPEGWVYLEGYIGYLKHSKEDACAVSMLEENFHFTISYRTHKTEKDLRLANIVLISNEEIVKIKEDKPHLFL